MGPNESVIFYLLNNLLETDFTRIDTQKAKYFIKNV